MMNSQEELEKELSEIWKDSVYNVETKNLNLRFELFKKYTKRLIASETAKAELDTARKIGLAASHAGLFIKDLSKVEDWNEAVADLRAKAVEGEKNKIRKAITLIQEYPQEVFHMYEGKLPWVIFEGRADEREKRAIYEAAFRDFTGLLKKLLAPHTNTT